MIVSLTTTSSRLGLCRVALLSLLGQSYLPQKIVVFLSQKGYLQDQGVEDISILRDQIGDEIFDNPLVEFRWVQNIGPYRKLLPILRESNADDLLVTADDDIFYGRLWLEKLVIAHRSNPGMVIAARVRAIRKNIFGIDVSYMLWGLIKEDKVITKDFVVTFGGGAVVRKSFFENRHVECNEFMVHAPTSDDIWFSEMIKSKHCPVYVCSSAQDELYFVDHSWGLSKSNLSKGRSLIDRIRFAFITFPLGYIGFPVCLNDISYKRTKGFFLNDSAEVVDEDSL